MTNLSSQVEASMTKRELEPADWMGGWRSKRKPPKKTPVGRRSSTLADLGIAASRELVDYMKASSDPLFVARVARLVSRSSTLWFPRAVRPVESLLFRHTPSAAVAFLVGAEVLADDPDAGATMIASWATPKSRSAVASFLFNDVAPSDKTYNDFVDEAPSIEQLLSGDEKKRSGAKTATAEMSRLYRRGIWVAQIIHGTRDVDACTADDVLGPAGNASPRALYTKERARFAESPHLAAYWLLAFAFVDDRVSLQDVLDRSREINHPVIVELRAALSPAVAGKPVVERWLARRRPEWTAEECSQIRARASRAMGPPGRRIAMDSHRRGAR